MEKVIDFYKILGVTPASNTNDIKKSYRRLVLKYHPDVSDVKNSEEHFKLIVKAFNVLSNPDKKKEYDKHYKVISPFPKLKEKKRAKKKKKFVWLPKIFNRLIINFKIFRSEPSNGKKNADEFFIIDEQLEKISPTEFIHKFYHSNNKYVRAEALKCLVIQAGKKCYKEIEKGLTDISKEVKLTAIRAVGYLNIRHFIKPLYKLYKKSGREVRQAIIEGLSKIDSQKSRQIISQACFDKFDEVRIQALKSIKDLNIKLSSSKLKNLLYEKNETIVKYAKELMESVS